MHMYFLHYSTVYAQLTQPLPDSTEKTIAPVAIFSSCQWLNHNRIISNIITNDTVEGPCSSEINVSFNMIQCCTITCIRYMKNHWYLIREKTKYTHSSQFVDPNWRLSPVPPDKINANEYIMYYHLALCLTYLGYALKHFENVYIFVLCIYNGPKGKFGQIWKLILTPKPEKPHRLKLVCMHLHEFFKSILFNSSFSLLWSIMYFVVNWAPGLGWINT